MTPGRAHATPLSRSQAVLLQAALGQGSDARRAFESWAASTDLATIDRGSARLLPLLWHNLLALGVEHRMLPLLKGVYRHTWFANQAVIERIRPILEQLDREGVPALLLKGVPLAHRYYANPGLRPMDDVDVLVRPADVAAAAAALRRLGWSSPVALPERLLRVVHGTEFRSPRGERLDLHSHLFTPSLRTDIDARRWERAIPISAGGLTFRSLDPTDQLVHVVVHGALSDPSAIRWFADATVILRREPEAIDWARFTSDVEDEGHGIIAAKGLRALVELLDASVPAGTLQALETRHRSFGQRVDHQIRTRPHVFFIGRIAKRYAHYRAWRSAPGLNRAGTGFLDYLQQVWEVDHVWQMPRQLVHHALDRLRLDVARARSSSGTGRR